MLGDDGVAEPGREVTAVLELPVDAKAGAGAVSAAAGPWRPSCQSTGLRGHTEERQDRRAKADGEHRPEWQADHETTVRGLTVLCERHADLRAEGGALQPPWAARWGTLAAIRRGAYVPGSQPSIRLGNSCGCGSRAWHMLAWRLTDTPARSKGCRTPRRRSSSPTPGATLCSGTLRLSRVGT